MLMAAALRPADHPSVVARFLDKVDVCSRLMFEGTPCWLWKAGKSRGQNRWSLKAYYGTFNPGGEVTGGIRAHVFIAWVAGLIDELRVPKGMNIDHRCKQALCCNPLHFEVVPAEVNQQRKYQ